MSPWICEKCASWRFDADDRGRGLPRHDLDHGRHARRYDLGEADRAVILRLRSALGRDLPSGGGGRYHVQEPGRGVPSPKPD